MEKKTFLLHLFLYINISLHSNEIETTDGIIVNDGRKLWKDGKNL